MNDVKCRRFDGKVAVITASTSGIGLAIAERLGLEGARVMVSSRKQEHVDEAVQKLKSQNIDAAGIVCHVGNRDDRARLFQKTIELFGGLDILVSNAAVNPALGPFFDTTEEQWDKIFDVNIKSAFLLCKEAVPYMEKRGGGAIILVSAVGGFMALQVSQRMAAYATSKTALFGLVKALSLNTVSKNIRVNGIAPGLIKTKFSEVLWESRENLIATIPMNRLGRPEECAGVVAFLASDDGSYVTGETVVVAGGLQSRL